MGLYDKRRSLSRRELKGTLRKHSGRIPGTGGKKYPRAQREGMTKDVFGRKYGSQISKDDYRGALRDLRSAKKVLKDRRARAEIDQKIRYLRELGGKNL